MENKLQLALILIGVAITLVLFSRSIGTYLFHLMDEFLTKKSQKGYDNFDDVVEARKKLFEKTHSAVKAAKQEKEKATEKAQQKLLEEANDEASLKRKEMVKRIYGLEVKRLMGENDFNYYSRFLKLKDNFNKDDLKKSYKELAQLYHPDKFDLSDFDEKTKKKLAAKTHENFVLVQKAYDYLKKI